MYVADTHGLVWHLTRDKKLGKTAFVLFQKTDKGEEIIIVPTIVLAEIMYVCERKEQQLKAREVLGKFRKSMNYPLYNLDFNVLEKAMALGSITELHDRIIIATALLMGAPLITKDETIIKSKLVKTIW